MVAIVGHLAWKTCKNNTFNHQQHVNAISDKQRKIASGIY
jgi:hypothetical protein